MVLPLAALTLTAAFLGGCRSQEVTTQKRLPSGFVDELVAKVELPTDLAFVPGGRLLVTSQTGKLWVIDRGRRLSQPALDVESSICSERERGLLGVTVDPRFEENHFVYVYYTHKKFGTCPIRNDQVPVNRTVRFRARDDGLLDPQSARILIDNVPSYNAIHNGGDLEFGSDGFLYVSIGDGGRDYARRTTTSAGNAAARDLNVLLGKIVRITPDGQSASGNPLSGPDSTVCATTGPVAPEYTCREIYAWGLRNPFRLAFDPNSSFTRFFINDVGEVTWEEVDEGRPGADYGWNLREGPCPIAGRVRCTPSPPHMTDPVAAYSHRHGCGAITGGAFVPTGVWPGKYDGDYLFVDFGCGKVFAIASRGGPITEFATGIPLVTSLKFVSSPSGTALYYTTFAEGGQLRRIVYRS
jgi:glucose/arabinose dehydrogenase